MLSDRHRWLKLVFGIVILCALGAVYADTAVSFEGGWFACREDPLACDGLRQILPLYRVESVSSEGFTVGKVARGVPVLAESAGVHVGDTVSIAGTFHAEDGAVVADSVRHHRLRPVKKGLGLLGLLLAMMWAPRCFAWRDGGLVLRG